MLTRPQGELLIAPTKRLLKPRRLDVAVKWRLFHNFRDNGDPEAERIYRWHILARAGARMQAGLSTDGWKQTLDDYVTSAEQLYRAMAQNGFDRSFPIPIDPNGEMLGGAHRLACALALGLDEVFVERREDYVWAPAWDYCWFVNAGFPEYEITRILDDWNALHQVRVFRQ